MPCSHIAGLQPPAPPSSNLGISCQATGSSVGHTQSSHQPADTPIVQVLNLMLGLILMIANSRSGGADGQQDVGQSANSEGISGGGCPAGGAQNPQAQTDFAQAIEALSHALGRAASAR